MSAQASTLRSAPRDRTRASMAVVLRPLSHPQLSEIRIEKGFAVGRTEQPFASYARELVVDLSRRHARIFCANDAVYLADLGSKFGTTVNRIDIRNQPRALHHGDEVCFGGALSYRVELDTPQAPQPRIIGVSLVPQGPDLDPIEIDHFPYVISKIGEPFARYRETKAAQLHYLSRQHAHIFLRDGVAYVADLASTNGTRLDGQRLGARAVPLHEDALLAFGGDHFVYRMHLRQAPPVTRVTGMPLARTTNTVEEPLPVDRTTFVAAPASFLEIFCADQTKPRDDDAAYVEGVGSDADRAASEERSKRDIALAWLNQAFALARHHAHDRRVQLGAAGAAVLAAIVLASFLWGASERQLKSLIADGAHAQAATLAGKLLQRDPDNLDLKALATEAVLKAHVPVWLDKLQARDFDGAEAALGDINALARHNADLRTLIEGLAWIATLERMVADRGGVDAPIRIYTDEDRIRAVLKRWDDDPHALQRALGRVAAHVREFKEPYARALTHLRKLQSDALVHLAAIDRLKAAITGELERDALDALPPILQEFAQKYPRLGGLDAVRDDLQRYRVLDSRARGRDLGPLVTQLASVRFATAPFAEKLRALKASDRVPPAEVARQYEAVLEAWRAGDAKRAFGALEKMTTGPWGEAAARELARKKTIVDRFTALQRTRGSAGHGDRLLAFHGTLDLDEDAYFARAIQAEVGALQDKAIARAQELLNRAQALWQRYRESGGIEGRQRLEASVSERFRAQAGLLREAAELGRRGKEIYAQLRVAHPAQWDKTEEAIGTEIDVQRRSLMELRSVLEPRLFRAKLALLGGSER